MMVSDTAGTLHTVDGVEASWKGQTWGRLWGDRHFWTMTRRASAWRGWEKVVDLECE